MNKFGFFIAFVAIVLFHCLIMTIKDYKDVIEKYAPGLNLHPAPIGERGNETEETQKYLQFKGYDYKNPNFSLIEEDGYDIDNDFDLFQEDLMKYVESQTEFTKQNQRLEPVATEQRTTALNPNVMKQPMILKEQNNNACKTGVDADISQKMGLDSSKANRDENRTNFYQLKPNDPTSETQNNGGLIDAASGLMAFDPESIDSYSIL